MLKDIKAGNPYPPSHRPCQDMGQLNQGFFRDHTITELIETDHSLQKMQVGIQSFVLGPRPNEGFCRWWLGFPMFVKVLKIPTIGAIMSLLMAASKEVLSLLHSGRILRGAILF